ncbi:hypothetical protein PCANC_26931 [Puccinia coronata f. sp. avenae]|uniref:Uncharacterized protein n=1 Tax=Puccinia coronata f. sp. avenae TaxID=200324 RepID=A0A2N5TQM8_9BASI|nr:hypothetical protein PCANC_26931 [Puccinia coronata f. sp. avenae]PLW42254.1 hypothetical protein PCASD_07703 [Puccinia coronata f. sp. avenae]
MIKDGKAKFPNVRIEQHNLVRQAFSKAQMRGELDYPNNPYAVGGPKEDLDPHTGDKKPHVTKKKEDNAKACQNNNNNRQNGGGGGRWKPYKGGRDQEENNNRDNRNNENNRDRDKTQSRNRSFRGPQDRDQRGGESQQGRKRQ